VKTIIMFILCFKQNPIIMFTKVVEIDPMAELNPRHIPRAFVGKS